MWFTFCKFHANRRYDMETLTKWVTICEGDPPVIAIFVNLWCFFVHAELLMTISKSNLLHSDVLFDPTKSHAGKSLNSLIGKINRDWRLKLYYPSALMTTHGNIYRQCFTAHGITCVAFPCTQPWPLTEADFFVKMTSHERHAFLNHWHLCCLLNNLFRQTPTKTPNLSLLALCDWFPPQRVSNAKCVSMS